MLRANEQFTLASEIGLKEARLEDYIVHALVDFDDIDYFTHVIAVRPSWPDGEAFGDLPF